MNETVSDSRRRLVLDSAVLVTLTAAVLYFFGMFFRIARLEEIGVPWDFARQWSLQEYALAGGVFAALLSPVVLVFDAVLAIAKHTRSRLAAVISHISPLRIVLLLLYTALASALIMLPLARGLAHTLVHYRVVEVTPRSGTGLAIPIMNTFYVTSNDREFVFVDKWADPRANLIIVPRDQVGTIVLRREMSSSSPAKLGSHLERQPPKP